jgi:pyruvyltransferase
MYLYWYNNNGKINNFGDVLNPYILEHLTGQKINYLPIAEPKFIRIIKSLKRVLLNQMSLSDLILVLKSLLSQKYYVAIGSVIESVKGKNCYVWGAGLINRNSEIGKSIFCAVRGEITKTRLKELGYRLPPTIGDPALLLPLIYTPPSVKKYELGIIPHYVQKDEILKENFTDSENILIIDLLNNPETIIDQINSCKKTISSSLHGIIVSQAYGIPSLWCKLGNKSLAGDDVKFEDYFSSVNIETYKRLQLNLKVNIIEQTNNLFLKYQKMSLINNELTEIQKNLIKNAPFDILKKYRELFSDK